MSKALGEYARDWWLRTVVADRIRWGKRVKTLLIIGFALFVCPGTLGAVAMAQLDLNPGVATPNTHAGLSSMSFTNVFDTYGVSVANYQFVGGHGSIFNPLETIIFVILSLLAIGYLMLGIVAVYLIGFILSFRWLDWFGDVLTRMGISFSQQLGTWAMLAIGVTIGAIFIGIFVLQGRFAKAAGQAFFMVAVAVIGPFFLASPMAEVVSSNGLLAMGRNLGVSLAAGLMGYNASNPVGLIQTMQAGLATNFIRRPLLWMDFGENTDASPVCAAHWSSAMTSGNQDAAMQGMKSCGATVAYNTALHPSFGQIGTAIILLICGLILLLFCVYLAIQIVWSVMDGAYHAFRAIFGFAAGGFIYGVFQRTLIHDAIGTLFCAIRVCTFTIFTAGYCLLFSRVFQEAGTNGTIPVLILGVVVMIVGYLQANKLASSLDRGTDQLSSDLWGSVQEGFLRGGEGGGGGDHPHTNHHLSFLAALGAYSTFHDNPISAPLAAKVMPWTLHARRRQMALNETRNWARSYAGIKPGGLYGLDNEYWGKAMAIRQARVSLGNTPGNQPLDINSHQGMANVINTLFRQGYEYKDIASIMTSLGLRDYEKLRINFDHYTRMRYSPEANRIADAHIQSVGAAMSLLMRNGVSYGQYDWDDPRWQAAVANLRTAVRTYAHHATMGTRDTSTPTNLTEAQQFYAQYAVTNPTRGTYDDSLEYLFKQSQPDGRGGKPDPMDLNLIPDDLKRAWRNSAPGRRDEDLLFDTDGASSTLKKIAVANAVNMENAADNLDPHAPTPSFADLENIYYRISSHDRLSSNNRFAPSGIVSNTTHRPPDPFP